MEECGKTCNTVQAPLRAWWKHLDAVLYEFLWRGDRLPAIPTSQTSGRSVCPSTRQWADSHCPGNLRASWRGCGVPLGPTPTDPQGCKRVLSLLLWNFPPGSARAFRNILKENVASLSSVILWPSGARSQTREWKGLVTSTFPAKHWDRTRPQRLSF